MSDVRVFDPENPRWRHVDIPADVKAMDWDFAWPSDDLDTALLIADPLPISVFTKLPLEVQLARMTSIIDQLK